ncbi:MAG: OmpA family protein [Myxococcales bacterium]|nr:OmpA family protein [Myxococcales bacterium]
MNRLALVALTTVSLAACGGNSPTTSPQAAETSGEETPIDLNGPAPEAQGFQLGETRPSEGGGDDGSSKLSPTATEALIRFTVVDKDKGPIGGIVISLTGADGQKYYTEETNMDGFAEVLVPAGKKYEVVYLSLGRKDITASVEVADEPRLTLNLKLRYKRWDPPAQPKRAGSVFASAPPESSPRFSLTGVEFETGKATLRNTSFAKLDSVVEYMTHKKTARIEISGHTDNVGKPNANKVLSTKRAEAVRDYLVSQGIDASRIEAVGYGDTLPIAPNDTEEGRQKNRRIEATEF